MTGCCTRVVRGRRGRVQRRRSAMTATTTTAAPIQRLKKPQAAMNGPSVRRWLRSRRHHSAGSTAAGSFAGSADSEVTPVEDSKRSENNPMRLFDYKREYKFLEYGKVFPAGYWWDSGTSWLTTSDNPWSIRVWLFKVIFMTITWS